MAAVTVRYVGIVGDIARRKEERLDLPAGTTVDGLLAALTGSNPTLGPVVQQLRAVVNGENAGRATELVDGDEVLLLRAIGGGA